MIYHLTNRVVVEITGEDSKSFLQGLITNDINSALNNNLIYAYFLSPQGRFLSDVFIRRIENAYLLDLPSGLVSDILTKLKIYKLRSQVNIALTEMAVIASANKQDDSFFEDPRTPAMGYRSFKTKTPVPIDNKLHEYEKLRIQNKIPDAELDFFYDKSFPLEFGANELHAIDYKKGCYVGQEVTTRTHYRGVIRKGIYKLKIITGSINKGEELYKDGIKMGVALGNDGNIGLALLTHENTSIESELSSINSSVKVIG